MISNDVQFTVNHHKGPFTSYICNFSKLLEPPPQLSNHVLSLMKSEKPQIIKLYVDIESASYTLERLSV